MHKKAEHTSFHVNIFSITVSSNDHFLSVHWSADTH